jgi:hypothetical protein
MYLPNLIKIDSGIENLISGGDIQEHRQHNDLISFFFLKIMKVHKLCVMWAIELLYAQGVLLYIYSLSVILTIQPNLTLPGWGSFPDHTHGPRASG